MPDDTAGTEAGTVALAAERAPAVNAEDRPPAEKKTTAEAPVADRQPVVVTAAQKLGELQRVPRRTRPADQTTLHSAALAAIAPSSNGAATEAANSGGEEQPTSHGSLAQASPRQRTRLLIVAAVVVAAATLATVIWYYATHPGLPDKTHTRQAPTQSSSGISAADAATRQAVLPAAPAAGASGQTSPPRNVAGRDLPAAVAASRPVADLPSPPKARPDAASYGRLLLSEPPSAGRSSSGAAPSSTPESTREEAARKTAACPAAVAAIGLCSQLAKSGGK